MKITERGANMVIYRVINNGTCVLTTASAQQAIDKCVEISLYAGDPDFDLWVDKEVVK